MNRCHVCFFPTDRTTFPLHDDERVYLLITNDVTVYATVRECATGEDD